MCSVYGTCMCVCVCGHVVVCAFEGRRGAGWFGWLAQCELFVSRGKQGGEKGEGVKWVFLSCLPVWLLLVTLLDEIRRDRLSALHLSLSHSRSERLEWN